MDVINYNRLGQVFTAANVSAKSVVAVSTTATGLILYNPAGSGKQIFILDAGFAWTTAPAAVHNLGIATQAPSLTAPATVTAAGSPVVVSNSSGNAGNSVTQAYDAATLAVAPVARRWFGGAVYGSGVGESPYSLIDHVDGAISAIPGGVILLCAVTTTAVGLGSFTWLELPYAPNPTSY